MRRHWWAVAALAGALTGVAAFTLPATDTSASTPSPVGPQPICVGAGAQRHCSAWAPRDLWDAGPVRTAHFVPVPSQPSIVAWAAWIDTSRTMLALYPGYEGPGPTSLPRGPEEVPLSARARLLATFNSGFYEKDGAAGFYTARLLYHPMIRGLATVVRYSDGRVDVVAWTGGTTPSSDVLMARQNLTLLVSGGQPTARAADNALWGITLGGVPEVWRTALGVTATGDLVYAAAPDQTSASLARIMVQLHCVRAMQLDINPAWPIFVTYAGRGAVGPALFVPNPNQIPNRFLYSSTKDFFALFTLRQPGEPQPW
ncbi:MAG TPA: phosphodiester glycosidase family protein [Acidimicrobiales bacterium]|nr:phosphodiester glycosidase family protein [Acidimicrobiales bacterium]